MRAIAFKSLAAQGAVPDVGAIRKALTASDEESQSNRLPGGRYSTLSGLLGRRHSLDVDPIIVAFYRTQSTQQLLAAVNWFSVDGHLAYRALASDRFDSFSTDLRSDLAQGFRRIKEESSQREEKKFGPEKWKRIAASFEEYDEFITQFTKAALIGLAENAQAPDAELVRPYLTQTDSSLRDLAVTVISDVGNSEDAVLS